MNINKKLMKNTKKHSNRCQKGRFECCFMKFSLLFIRLVIFVKKNWDVFENDKKLPTVDGEVVSEFVPETVDFILDVEFMDNAEIIPDGASSDEFAEDADEPPMRQDEMLKNKFSNQNR